MIDADTWRKASYYAVREDFNNNLHGHAPESSGIENNKKLDAVIRAGVEAFIKDEIPAAASFVELDAIYHAMRRRGIVDPKDPSNQQTLRLKGYAKRKGKAA